MTRAINRAWGIRKDRPFYIAIPRQMAMTMILGGLLLLSTAGTSFIQLLSSERFPGGEREPLLDLGLSALALYLIPWAITLLVFLLIYRYVPNRRMHWRYVWPGAVTAAVFFETGKLLFWWYLENIAIYDQVYGPLTSVVVLMIWAYLSAWVLILGAEISYEYERIFYPQDQEEIQLTAPSSSP
jgi:membrane protein